MYFQLGSTACYALAVLITIIGNRKHVSAIDVVSRSKYEKEEPLSKLDWKQIENISKVGYVNQYTTSCIFIYSALF